ncbi:MAG: glycerol-3-phosphate acyltransferase [Ilumatobacteraceae bacterium]
MPPFVRVALPVVAGYLIGSFPTADLVSGRRRVDLRAVGDRNPGWWNARQALGNRAARPVLVGDIAKGMLAAGVGRGIARDDEWWPGVVGGGGAMVGHAWPVFAGLRGGRAVATLGGVAGVLSPRSAALAVGAGAAAFAVCRSAATAVQAGFVAFPLAQLVVDGPRRTAATGVLMSFVGLRFAMAGVTRRAAAQ